MKVKEHPLIIVDVEETGRGRIHCPIPEQLTEKELKLVKSLIADIAKQPEILGGVTPGRYSFKVTKMNPFTKNAKFDLIPM